MLVAGIAVLFSVAVVTLTFLVDLPDDGFGRLFDSEPFIENMPVDTGQAASMANEELAVEMIAGGFHLPTGMAFVGEQTAIVIEKNTGLVFLADLEEGVRKELLRLNVARGAEQGLLGIAVADTAKVRGSDSDKVYVFLYLTQADADRYPVGNRVYRYEWSAENQVLVNPRLIVSLPANPGPTHNGGKLVASEQGHLYVVTGDLNRVGGPLQNVEAGALDDTSVILRVDFDGKPVADNPFVRYGRDQLSKYYAYGIRNSFGLAIDPITGTLWATENGMNIFDEINIVQPGFNSGWQVIMGPLSRSNIDSITQEPRDFVTTEDLFMLEGAHYRDPVFSWRPQVGPTDIEFLRSDRLGENYRNNLFVGDINGGILYFFKVNENRDGLDLSDHPDLADGVAESYEEAHHAKIGIFPGGIVHLETGPDGLLYVLTFGGNIYRITPGA
jgi:aldose sugar dehydrogenase